MEPEILNVELKTVKTTKDTVRFARGLIMSTETIALLKTMVAEVLNCDEFRKWLAKAGYTSKKLNTAYIQLSKELAERNRQDGLT